MNLVKKAEKDIEELVCDVLSHSQWVYSLPRDIGVVNVANGQILLPQSPSAGITHIHTSEVLGLRKVQVQLLNTVIMT